MNGNNITEEKALEERAKFIGAFNGTMIDIWKEKIVDMDIIDTGSLLDSVAALPRACRRPVLRGRHRTVFSRIWPLAGLRDRPGGMAGKSRRHRPRQGERTSPVVLDQILLVGDELARFLWLTAWVGSLSA